MSASDAPAADAVAAASARSRFPPVRADAPLVVFDFDHTLYDGDSGSHLFAWLIRRSAWRKVLALLITPVFAPMIAFLRTRRIGISAYVWAGTIGLHRQRDLDLLIDAYVAGYVPQIRARLLPIGLDQLHLHRQRGDNVIVATGAPPRLARAILAFVAHEDVPVIGTLEGARFGALGAVRHCHGEEKVRMIREAGYDAAIAVAYSDSLADLPLLVAAESPVVVNPKKGAMEAFERALGPQTPMLNWGCIGRGGEPATPPSSRDA